MEGEMDSFWISGMDYTWALNDERGNMVMLVLTITDEEEVSYGEIICQRDLDGLEVRFDPEESELIIWLLPSEGEQAMELMGRLERLPEFELARFQAFLGMREAIPVLKNHLKQSNPEGRRNAVAALASLMQHLELAATLEKVRETENHPEVLFAMETAMAAARLRASSAGQAEQYSPAEALTMLAEAFRANQVTSSEYLQGQAQGNSDGRNLLH